MNFSKFDMTLLIVMALAIISMALVFPGLGLTDDDPTEDDDLPALEMESDRFDIAGEFPDRPGTPNTGHLDYDVDDTQRSDQQAEFQGDETRAIVTMIDEPGGTTETGYLNWEVFDQETADLIDSEDTTFEEEGEYHILSADEWEIEVDITAFDDSGEYEATYELTERETSDGGWLSGLPVIGTAADVGSSLAGYVAWIGSVMWWFVSFTFEVFLNLIGILFDVVGFAFGLLAWLVGTYSAIVTGANGVATLFVSIPGLILSLLFAKLGFIGISLLPTT